MTKCPKALHVCSKILLLVKLKFCPRNMSGTLEHL